MDMKTQTIEQFLFEQLEKIAPGKYTLANVLDLFKSRLRFPCTHLKGGSSPRALRAACKDYNLSIFTFPNGVIEIKCLYNCGLKVRSDETDMQKAFNELHDLRTTNNPAKAENVWLVKNGVRLPLDPGPTPTYSDEVRQRIKQSTDLFWKAISQGVESGRIKPNDPILGAVLPHPEPIEAPDSRIARGMQKALLEAKSKQPVLKGVVVAFDSVPPLTTPETRKKIRKAARQSRRKRG